MRKHMQKLLQNIKRLFATLSALIVLSSCAKITIKDSEWCGDVGSDGAACFYTMADKQRMLTKPEWDAERFGMICTKSENFKDWKAALEKLCHMTKRCDEEDIRQANQFFSKVEYLQAQQLLH